NKVRQEILESSKIYSIVDFNSLKVFNDAGTTSLILSQKKSKNIESYVFDLISLNTQEFISSELFDKANISEFSYDELDNSGISPWNFYQDNFKALNTEFKLSNYFEISQGVVTGADRVTKKHIVKKL